MTSVSWGGCLEVIEWVLTAGQFPVDAGVLDGGVLILETSEELLPARNVGLDASAAMLAIAAGRLGPGVRLHRGDLTGPLAFPDGAFDVVLAALVMHYLPDWSPTLREFHRVLIRGGRLVISTHHPFMDHRMGPRDQLFRHLRLHRGMTGGPPHREDAVLASPAERDDGIPSRSRVHPGLASRSRSHFRGATPGPRGLEQFDHGTAIPVSRRIGNLKQELRITDRWPRVRRIRGPHERWSGGATMAPLSTGALHVAAQVDRPVHRRDYHYRVHQETGQPPVDRWLSTGWLGPIDDDGAGWRHLPTRG